MSKLSLTLYTFSVTGPVAGLFLTKVYRCHMKELDQVENLFKRELILSEL